MAGRQRPRSSPADTPARNSVIHMADAPKRGRGRPPYAPTDADRARVEVMVSCGYTQKHMAGELGISDATLAKNFAEQLNHGTSRVTARVKEKVLQQALEGDLRAALKWLDMVDLQPPRRVQKPEPKPAPLGKKQIAQRVAETAAQDTDWADLVSPAKPN